MLIRLTLLGLTLIAIITFADWISSPVQLCEVTIQQSSEPKQENQRPQEYCSAGKIIAIWRVVGRWVDAWHDDIAAASTAVIALFTIVLVLVSNRQAHLTRKSVEISEIALLGLERPRLVIIDVNFGFTDDKRRAQIGVINFGRDPGRITQIFAKFFEDSLPVIPDFTAAESRDLDSWVLPSTTYDQPRQGRVGFLFEGPRKSRFFAIRILYEWDFGKYERACACTTAIAPAAVPETTGGSSYNYDQKRA
jgi:hypothetical protein